VGTAGSRGILAKAGRRSGHDVTPIERSWRLALKVVRRAGHEADDDETDDEAEHVVPSLSEVPSRTQHVSPAGAVLHLSEAGRTEQCFRSPINAGVAARQVSSQAQHGRACAVAKWS